MSQTSQVGSRTERVATAAGMVGIRRWGEGAPEVVLLHGAGGNRESLAPLGDALATIGLTAAALSMPARVGSGGQPYETLAEAARWVAAAVEALAPDGTVLLGHSMGGGIAIETVLGTHAPVRGVVLAATGARLRVHPTILQTGREMAEAGQNLAELSAASLLPDGPATARSHVLTVEALTPGEVAVADWHATDRFDRLSDVGALGLPILAIAGEVDHLTPVRYAEYVAEHAPSADLVVLPGAGHWLPMEEADRVADLVGAFVRRAG